MTTDSSLERLVSEFFAGSCPPEAVTRAEATGLDTRLWDAAEQLGFPLVGLDERRGGSGGSLSDLLVLLHVAGRHAAPLPLAETNLAAWLLHRAGRDAPSGPMTVVPGAERDTLTLREGVLSGVAHGVPWATGARRVVALLEDENGSLQVVSPALTELTIHKGSDLAGMSRDTLVARDVPVDAAPWTGTPDALFVRGALLRSAQMAGALEEILELTRDYVGQRTQFGRAIGSFQSVQQHVVTLAQASTMSSLAVRRAGHAAATGDASFEVCATKLVLNQQSALATRAAHQAHGAIGMTQEYRLQHFTRRLHGWRGEFGDEQGLALRIGAAVARRGGLARVITAPSATVGV
ncbi:MAG TPA: acyl-CoA dehydrogenase family protein [Amycolatopsis sp.]|nr:acyl-CoA dehydrogenase family protein [Amycolatopsis sp.]